MDIKKFLETVDKFNFAGEKAGQQSGQQWQGTDKGLPGTKLVGEKLESNVVLIQDPKSPYVDKLDLNVAAQKYNFNANYIKQQLQHQDFTQVGNIRVIKPTAVDTGNVIKELDKHVKETSKERELKRDFDNFDSEDWAEWDAKIKRLKQRVKQGELVTVWDKEKRVYKNVPKSEIKEYGNAQNPDAQTTTPGAGGSEQQDKEDDLGAKLGAAATQQSISQLKTIEPNLNPQLAKIAIAKGDQPTTMTSAETAQAKELSDLVGTALSNPQTSSQVTALLRKAAQLKKS
jgi:hypothetical protein